MLAAPLGGSDELLVNGGSGDGDSLVVIDDDARQKFFEVQSDSIEILNGARPLQEQAEGDLGAREVGLSGISNAIDVLAHETPSFARLLFAVTRNSLSVYESDPDGALVQVQSFSVFDPALQGPNLSTFAGDRPELLRSGEQLIKADPRGFDVFDIASSNRLVWLQRVDVPNGPFGDLQQEAAVDVRGDTLVFATGGAAAQVYKRGAGGLWTAGQQLSAAGVDVLHISTDGSRLYTGLSDGTLVSQPFDASAQNPVTGPGFSDSLGGRFSALLEISDGSSRQLWVEGRPTGLSFRTVEVYPVFDDFVGGSSRQAAAGFPGSPYGLAYDEAREQVYIADGERNQIRTFTARPGFVPTGPTLTTPLNGSLDGFSGSQGPRYSETDQALYAPGSGGALLRFPIESGLPAADNAVRQDGDLFPAHAAGGARPGRVPPRPGSAEPRRPLRVSGARFEARCARCDPGGPNLGPERRAHLRRGSRGVRRRAGAGPGPVRCLAVPHVPNDCLFLHEPGVRTHLRGGRGNGGNRGGARALHVR